MSRPKGFRFYPTDAIVIAALAAATGFMVPRLGTYGWLPAVVGLHFFLFCNVFRVRRRLELVWAATFLVNFAAWTLSGAFSWLGVLAVQTPVTLLVLLATIRSPRYVGVFAK